MIISEKQIMQLIQLANLLAEILLMQNDKNVYPDIKILINEIALQQSTDLKEVK